MKAPRTIFRRPFALLRWHYNLGPRYLEAARIRRQGNTSKALALLAGPLVIIDMMRAFPQDLVERERCARSICRKLCAGKHL